MKKILVIFLFLFSTLLLTSCDKGYDIYAFPSTDTGRTFKLIDYSDRLVSAGYFVDIRRVRTHEGGDRYLFYNLKTSPDANDGMRISDQELVNDYKIKNYLTSSRPLKSEYGFYSNDKEYALTIIEFDKEEYVDQFISKYEQYFYATDLSVQRERTFLCFGEKELLEIALNGDAKEEFRQNSQMKKNLVGRFDYLSFGPVECLLRYEKLTNVFDYIYVKTTNEHTYASDYVYIFQSSQDAQNYYNYLESVGVGDYEIQNNIVAEADSIWMIELSKIVKK